MLVCRGYAPPLPQRELQEESGVVASEIKQVGVVEFEFTSKQPLFAQDSARAVITTADCHACNASWWIVTLVAPMFASPAHTDKPKVLEVHVFTCDAFSGEPVERRVQRVECRQPHTHTTDGVHVPW